MPLSQVFGRPPRERYGVSGRRTSGRRVGPSRRVTRVGRRVPPRVLRIMAPPRAHSLENEDQDAGAQTKVSLTTIMAPSVHAEPRGGAIGRGRNGSRDTSINVAARSYSAASTASLIASLSPSSLEGGHRAPGLALAASGKPPHGRLVDATARSMSTRCEKVVEGVPLERRRDRRSSRNAPWRLWLGCRPGLRLRINSGP